MEYLEFVYRREFHLTPEEMGNVPTGVFLRDLQFMSLEVKANEWKNPSK